MFDEAAIRARFELVRAVAHTVREPTPRVATPTRIRRRTRSTKISGAARMSAISGQENSGAGVLEARTQDGCAVAGIREAEIGPCRASGGFGVDLVSGRAAIEGSDEGPSSRSPALDLERHRGRGQRGVARWSWSRAFGLHG